MENALIVDLETTTPGPKPDIWYPPITAELIMRNSDTEAAWAAGFLVADGTMGIYGTGRPTKRGPGWTVRLRAANADLAPLLQLQGIFGGAIWPLTTRPHQTTQHFEWCVQGSVARGALSRVFPFLTGRHRWLAALLTLFPHHARGSGGHGYTEEEHKHRKEIVAWSRQAIKTHL